LPHNVEKDFLEAYYRLSAGAPLNDKLKVRVAKGKLRVNENTVAMEAGHSRTLLSQRAPGYERICALLFPSEYLGATRIADPDHATNRPDGETQAEKIQRLSLDKAQLTTERDLFATQYAEACLAIELLHRKISVLSGEVDRRERNLSETERSSEQKDPA
jgi:hypothetical protein